MRITGRSLLLSFARKGLPAWKVASVQKSSITAWTRSKPELRRMRSSGSFLEFIQLMLSGSPNVWLRKSYRI